MESQTKNSLKMPLSTVASRAKANARRSSTLMGQGKIGVGAKPGFKAAKFLTDRLKKKLILVVPQSIKDAHPDKHFAYINGNKYQKNGFFHPGGYQPLRVEQDPTNFSKEKFQESNLHNYLQRNEMILAYISKDEYESRQEDERLFRELRDPSSNLLNDQNLEEFAAYSARESSQESLLDILAEQENLKNGGQHG